MNIAPNSQLRGVHSIRTTYICEKYIASVKFELVRTDWKYIKAIENQAIVRKTANGLRTDNDNILSFIDINDNI